MTPVDSALGHQWNPNNRPLRLAGAKISQMIIGLLNIPVILHYWISRETMGGIATWPILIQNLSGTLDTIVTIWLVRKNLTSWFAWAWFCLLQSPQAAIVLIKTWKVLRLEFNWIGWIPKFSRRQADRIERLSIRKETSIWRSPITILVSNS